MTDRRRRDDTIRAVDLFCGAGGLSWGLVQALVDLADNSNRPLEDVISLAAVNHWERAIETHERNFSWADHYHAKVEELDPRSVFDTERVDILVGGPQCTHHSNARGSRPVDEQKRASPWHVLDWLQKLYVDNFVIENVPEFEHWGPVGADGTPMKSKRGETFAAWIDALHSLGYTVDWQVLNAADFGDATSRRRLFIIGRRQGRPEWPEQTHSEDGEKLGTDPWRPAAEIIDWSDPGESIWSRDLEDGRRKPLKNTTMQRLAEGLRRYGHDDLEPFADALAEIGRDDVYAMREAPVPVENVSEAVERRCEPFLVTFEGTPKAKPVDEPVDTIIASSQQFGLCVPCLLGQQSGARPRTVCERPTPTIATRGAISLFEPEAFILPRNVYHRGIHSNPAYDPEERPLHTVTAKNHDGYVVSPYLVQYNGESDANNVGEPLPTVTTRDRFALCLPDLLPWGLDVRFRMLQPRELAAAMGFPADYEFAGTKTETIEQIGNAVPVALARALCAQLLSSRDPTLKQYASGAEPAAETGGASSDD